MLKAKLYRKFKLSGKSYVGTEDKHKRDTMYILDLFPENFFRDKTILDIGCAGGAICFLAGAKSATGIDTNKERVAAANKIKKENEIESIDFICGNVNEWYKGQFFDCVFLLNVLHHEKDPSILLNKLRCKYICIEHPVKGYFSSNNAYAPADKTVICGCDKLTKLLPDFKLIAKRKSSAYFSHGKRRVMLFEKI